MSQNPEPLVVRDGEEVIISDLDTAAFLLLKGLRVIYGERDPNSRYKVFFVFRDPDGRAESLVMDFVHSVFSDYADCIRRMKKIVHRFGGRGSR